MFDNDILVFIKNYVDAIKRAGPNKSYKIRLEDISELLELVCKQYDIEYVSFNNTDIIRDVIDWILVFDPDYEPVENSKTIVVKAINQYIAEKRVLEQLDSMSIKKPVKGSKGPRPGKKHVKSPKVSKKVHLKQLSEKKKKKHEYINYLRRTKESNDTQDIVDKLGSMLLDDDDL
jgi:hypothetical protein